MSSVVCLTLALSLGYAKPDLLIEAADLAKADSLKAYRILDARDKKKYDARHVPGSIWVDHESWSKTFGKTQDPNVWAPMIGGLGIDANTKVVVLDDALAKDAARIWWILRYWGVKDARILNGGWTAWKSGDHPVSTEIPNIETRTFRPMAAGSRLAAKENVLGIVNDKKGIQILDARSEKEHCGDEKLKNQRGGAIPGAMQLEWSDALDKSTQKFKSTRELSQILKEAGVDLSKPIVTHCQSGGRAAVMAFTLELMGAENVANYYRGWSEWGNDENAPIERPTPKKK